jgi:glyoxylate reductase
MGLVALKIERPVILDTTPLAPHVRDRLPGSEFIDLTPPEIDPDVLRSVLQRVHAIINPSNLPLVPGMLDEAVHLKIVAQVARGYDNIDPIDLARRGIWATNVPDAFTVPTAEVAIGLLLMVARHLERGAATVRRGEWSTVVPGEWDGFSLAGKALGIVGYGQIGQAVAARARAFGMRVAYTQRRRVTDSPDAYLPLDDLLARCDVVSLHAPLTAETHHLLNADRLARVKPGAVLINTGRGGLVDQEALIAALERGQLRGAGLDVVEDEPVVPERLRLMPNVVITPHLAGSTVESHAAAQDLAMSNVIAVLRGERPESALNEPVVR